MSPGDVIRGKKDDQVDLSAIHDPMQLREEVADIAARVIDVTGRVVRLQSGYLYHYAFAMLIGVAALVTWMMLGGAN